jgi:hypothetical protein
MHDTKKLPRVTKPGKLLYDGEDGRMVLEGWRFEFDDWPSDADAQRLCFLALLERLREAATAAPAEAFKDRAISWDWTIKKS